MAKNIRGALPSPAKALAMLRGESSEDDDDSETDKSELSSFIVVVEALIVTPSALLVSRLVILEGTGKEEHDSCCSWRVESMLEEMASSKNRKKTTMQAGTQQKSKNCRQKPMGAEKHDNNPKWRRRI